MEYGEKACNGNIQLKEFQFAFIPTYTIILLMLSSLSTFHLIESTFYKIFINQRLSLSFNYN